MKKTNIISALFLAAITTLSGCADQNPLPAAPVSADGKNLLTVSFEGHTRTSLSPDGGGYDLLWSDGDAIAVIGSDGSSSTFGLSAGSGTACGTFAGELSKSGNPPYCAVYPDGTGAVIRDGRLIFDIPQTGGRIPAVAAVKTDGASVSADLMNIFGLLKITLSSPCSVEIKKLTLHDLGGNMLWGTCSLPVADGLPDYSNIALEGGDNTISIISDGSYTIGSEATSFFFPVPPSSLDRGFSIVLYEYDPIEKDSIGRAYTFLQKVTDPVPARRATVLNMDEAVITEKSEPLDVKARGYYKSLFVCAGCYLSNYYTTEHIPSIAELGLADDYEYIATATRAQLNGSTTVKNLNIKGQNAVMVSSPQDGMTTYPDSNGALIYPDGEPRFRAMYVNGGTSYTFGPSLTDKGRKQIHDWFLKGGSYIGTCAGSFLATTYRDGTNRWNNADASMNYSFGLWPGNIASTSVPVDIFKYPAAATGARVLEDYAKLDYATRYAQKHGLSGRAWERLSANDTIEDLAHHGGSYLPHSATNAKYPHDELIAMQWSGPGSSEENLEMRYTEDKVGVTDPFKSSRKVHDSTIVWAYKKDNASGRAVLCGSHPEKRGLFSGRNFNLMANMLLYAMDGAGEPDIKGEMQLNDVRKMNRTAMDEDPDYARIGDRQYHHFLLNVPSPVENFYLELDSDYDAASGINLYLTLRKGGFAWLSDADYVICSNGGRKSLHIKNLPAGKWYIGVYCATTVVATPYAYDAETGPFFFKYSGHTEVLEGIPYTLSCEVAGNDGISGIDVLPGHDLGSDDGFTGNQGGRFDL